MELKALFSISTLLLFTSCSYSQSNPAPFDLSSGNYSFAQWDGASSPGTYPANGVFQIHTIEDPILTDEPTGDWLCLYNITTRSRVVGEGIDGVSFINTSSIQDDQARCGNGVNDIGGYIGAFVVALNGAGRENIEVSWLNALLSQSDGTPAPREYHVKLQYRVGISATWSDVPGSNEFSNAGLIAGDVQNFGPLTLPVECNNQPIVQVRWKYFEHLENDGGTRPRIRLDEISITSDFATGIETPVSSTNVSIYPNPATGLINFNKKISGELINSTGQLVKTFSAASTLSLENIEAGVYFIHTSEGRVNKLFVK